MGDEREGATGSAPPDPVSHDPGAATGTGNSVEEDWAEAAQAPPGSRVAWTPDDLSDVWTRSIGYGVDAVLLGTAGVIVSLYVLCLTPVWRLTQLPLYAGASFALLLGIYCTILVGSSARTLGHSLLGLTVVRTDGSRVSYGRAFVRWLGYLLCTATVFLGFVIAVWDESRQGLHDKMADTVVIGPRASLAAKVWASAVLLALLGTGAYGIAWLLGLGVQG
jgi:uncharacterized RDD family membrane protein YckC